jgi:hypothetical protein
MTISQDTTTTDESTTDEESMFLSEVEAANAQAGQVCARSSTLGWR